MAAMQEATILAIDDQDDNLALLEALLLPQGVDFHAAADGPTGLKLAEKLAPDLILLDLAMPGMDGFAVLERLRAAPTTRTIPVIVLTANYREAGSIARGFELGATEYLTKPIQLDELLVRIRSTLRLGAAERELARLRRDFASMLVHDMRAPLDAVRLVLGGLKRQVPDQAELLELALGSLTEVGGLIDDLLDINRMEESGYRPELGAVAPGALIAAAIQTLQPIAEAKGLVLTATCPELPLMRADPRLLRRVLDNLIANALKFTEEGGVTVRARGTTLEVQDTGPGIAAQALPRVFDRYYTGHHGFGLGLAFCARAVQAMGGRITVESVEGAGSTFRVTLPAH
ncbi:MAG: response regulator receiver sensor signal transduction histidine kinase [Cyanobacteria bacterium RYN_339]|nr:response regulator receiver sensor signal transduction histidine kinase [Cyanobacteria bacterium RYN_339]